MNILISNKPFRMLGWCLFFLLVFSLLTQLFGLPFWQRDNPFALNLYVFQGKKENADIIILGSSRARMGLLPREIEQRIHSSTGGHLTLFNLAQLGGGIRTSHRILRDVLSMGKPPKLIILEVFPGQFNSNSIFLNNTYFKYFASTSDILSSFDTGLRSGDVSPRVHGLIRNAAGLWGFLVSNPKQQSYRLQLEVASNQEGAFPLPTVEDFNQLSQEKRILLRDLGTAGANKVEWVREKGGYVISGAADKAFQNMLSLCRKHGIHILIISMPTLDKSERSESNDIHSQFTKYIADNCNGKQVKFRELGDEIALQREDYWDNSHLNRNGAVIVSDYLVDTILVPGMKDLKGPGSGQAYQK